MFAQWLSAAFMVSRAVVLRCHELCLSPSTLLRQARPDLSHPYCQRCCCNVVVRDAGESGQNTLRPWIIWTLLESLSQRGLCRCSNVWEALDSIPAAARGAPFAPPATHQQPTAARSAGSLQDQSRLPSESKPDNRPNQGPFARVGASGPATSAGSAGATAGSSGGGGARSKTPLGALQAKRVASGALDSLSPKPILVTVCCGSQTGVYDVRKGSVTIRFGLQGKVGKRLLCCSAYCIMGRDATCDRCEFQDKIPCKRALGQMSCMQSFKVVSLFPFAAFSACLACGLTS